MTRIDLIARTLTGIIAFGFLFAGIFDVLDYFIMKFFLFGLFATLVIYIVIILNKNEIHHKV
ncbi:MAG TPA: hypothetical protein VNJ50_08445 [Gelidibacter sp.]|uniref:hypothetical protein n=1 Tax=Gelidibacter sp. TaxID=2018083 RepID=UPI002B63F179|nr:hypothetical protein [Gelidibacter sp.]HXJ98860.1 hypothetical protein [Gelidibacter sp.]